MKDKCVRIAIVYMTVALMEFSRYVELVISIAYIHRFKPVCFLYVRIRQNEYLLA